MENEETKRVKSKYDRISLFYDLSELPIEALFFKIWRQLAFSRLKKGRVLEVGAGTGKNFPYYTSEFKVLATDISEKMLAKAEGRARKLKTAISIKRMDAQKLELPDSTFDSTLSTFVFCSVPDPIAGLKELKRVLKNDGIAVFLEHVRPHGILGMLFDFLNYFSSTIMGVNINRDTVDNIRKAGFDIIEDKDLFLEIIKLIVAKPKITLNVNKNT